MKFFQKVFLQKLQVFPGVKLLNFFKVPHRREYFMMMGNIELSHKKIPPGI